MISKVKRNSGYFKRKKIYYFDILLVIKKIIIDITKNNIFPNFLKTNYSRVCSKFLITFFHSFLSVCPASGSSNTTYEKLISNEKSEIFYKHPLLLCFLRLYLFILLDVKVNWDPVNEI